jgi:hypothetical protein
VLRGRALERGLRAPLMVGAAPVETVARIVETLPDIASGEGRIAAQLVREIHMRAGVPVLVVDEGSAAASTLEMWTESRYLTGLWGGSPLSSPKHDERGPHGGRSHADGSCQNPRMDAILRRMCIAGEVERLGRACFKS